eukprot:760198-Amphidinium_carterae.3
MSRTSYLRSSRETRSQFKPWAMLFLSIEEPRLTVILRQLQTIGQPITGHNVILEEEAERSTSLSKVILHRLLSMTQFLCGYEVWRQLNIQYYGGSVARQYMNLELILSPRTVKIGKHYYIHSVVMDGFVDKMQISKVRSMQHFPKNHAMGFVDQT